VDDERKKVRALYVFEVVLAIYLLSCIAIQTWLVYWR
jgi:hypothetical protein